MTQAAPQPHVILFEHINFRGAHKHVFDSEPDLGASNDDFFNDKTSSIVILAGNWRFYRDKNFEGVERNGHVLGPGIYPWVEDVQITNDELSSLEPELIVYPV